MAIEIAAGILIAVAILALLPVILCAGLVLLAAAVGIILIMFVGWEIAGPLLITGAVIWIVGTAAQNYREQKRERLAKEARYKHAKQFWDTHPYDDRLTYDVDLDLADEER